MGNGAAAGTSWTPANMIWTPEFAAADAERRAKQAERVKEMKQQNQRAEEEAKRSVTVERANGFAINFSPRSEAGADDGADSAGGVTHTPSAAWKKARDAQGNARMFTQMLSSPHFRPEAPDSLRESVAAMCEQAYTTQKLASWSALNGVGTGEEVAIARKGHGGDGAMTASTTSSVFPATPEATDALTKMQIAMLERRNPRLRTAPTASVTAAAALASSSVADVAADAPTAAELAELAQQRRRSIAHASKVAEAQRCCCDSSQESRGAVVSGGYESSQPSIVRRPSSRGDTERFARSRLGWVGWFSSLLSFSLHSFVIIALLLVPS